MIQRRPLRDSARAPSSPKIPSSGNASLKMPRDQPLALAIRLRHRGLIGLRFRSDSRLHTQGNFGRFPRGLSRHFQFL